MPSPSTGGTQYEHLLSASGNMEGASHMRAERCKEGIQTLGREPHAGRTIACVGEAPRAFGHESEAAVGQIAHRFRDDHLVSSGLKHAFHNRPRVEMVQAG